MCTLTLVPWQTAAGRGVRIACNRDESRARPAAWPPEIRLAEGRRMIMPVDPVSDGTWIGVSDAGLAAVLLNAYPAGLNAAALELVQPPPVSRGTIIPALLGSGHFEELIEQATAIDTSRYAPFRLVLADAQEAAELHCVRGSMQLRFRTGLSGPLMFTSSGLGDELVDRPRRELFQGWFHDPADWPAEQDAFHRQRWPEAPELSVCMSRPEAHTVSYTVVELTPGSAALVYHPAPPNRPSQATVVRLRLA